MYKKNYYDLDVWKKTRKLASLTYEITRKYPKDEIFGITAQLRRAAVSIPSNVAEGCGRNTSKDTMQFLFIARGSLYELETQFFISLDLEYITESKLEEILDKVTDCKQLLNGFINYYRDK